MIKEPTRVQRELISVRDTIESIWVAIILAFILRAFMVEAFVIPTGSMAPRLMGQHFELQCPGCGWEYPFTAPQTSPTSPPLDTSVKHSVSRSRCPNCGKIYDAGKEYLNSGDRVLVMKFLYNFTEPRPWDVVVFRNPQDNDQNYIKRLIGLPGETLMLVQGDVFVKASPVQAFFEPRRKDDPRIQEAMWQVIYDNDYRPDEKDRDKNDSAAPQWDAGGQEAWNLREANGRHFLFAGTAGPDDWRDIRFRATPSVEDPRAPRRPGESDPDADATRELFLPNYGYNPFMGYTEGDDNQTAKLSPRDVCGDLKLSARFVPLDPLAKVALTVTNFSNAFQAVVSADGTVRLLHGSIASPGVLPTSWTDLVPPARLKRPLAVRAGCRVTLTHTDYRLTVWIDEQPVLQTTDKDYTARVFHQRGTTRLEVLVKGIPAEALKTNEYVSAPNVPTPMVRIAAAGGPCRLEHTSLFRDVYYTGHRLSPTGHTLDKRVLDYASRQGLRGGDVGWGVLNNPITLQKDIKPSDTGAASDRDLDSFLVLGDNSPCSLDSRAWIEAAPTLRLYAPGGSEDKPGRALYQLGTVPRYNMIGKALFVYWPSGHRLRGLPRLPIIPNVGRMRLIR